MKFNEHSETRQATKRDLVDIANALGLDNIHERLFTVPEIRASIRMRLLHLAEAGKLTMTTPEDFQKRLDARSQARADHEEACEDGEANTPHGQALIASRYARLCELEAQCAAEIFQELLERRAAIETELRRPIQTTRERVAELHAELETLQRQIDEALAEASKETP
jgi:hypothetical protein